MIGSVDVIGRAAFGVLCIAGMLLEAIPLLFVVGVVGGIGIALDGNYDRAVYVWLGSWAAMTLAALLFMLIAYVFWPLASDWITEWQGYATAFAIGGIGLGIMSLTVLLTDWPLALELIVPVLLTFLIGFCIPGWFLGLNRSMPTIRDRPRRKAAAKR